jgi:peptidyl-prolyl cis-trans isomerase SDCCAG10
MIQMGDPTGTGQGGESIWGKAFKDEIHGRIRFNHRGQVAMANENKPNSNHSQFFITLGACTWLDNKHTIFGKVTGNTFYNLVRMSEVEVGEGDKPVDSIIITTVEVLMNPFDDIIPRQVLQSLAANSEFNDLFSDIKKKESAPGGNDAKRGKEREVCSSSVHCHLLMHLTTIVSGQKGSETAVFWRGS